MKEIPHKVIRVHSIPACDFCQNGTPGPYDFKTNQGPWAHGCQKHWVEHRACVWLGLGWGQYWFVSPTGVIDEPEPMTLGAILRHKQERNK